MKTKLEITLNNVENDNNIKFMKNESMENRIPELWNLSNLGNRFWSQQGWYLDYNVSN